MNFYVGEISEIDIKGYNVLFDEDLFEYLYKLQGSRKNQMKILLEIDPYDDVIIFQENIEEIIKACTYVLDFGLLENYKKREEGICTMQEMIHISELALAQKKPLVSIGD